MNDTTEAIAREAPVIGKVFPGENLAMDTLYGDPQPSATTADRYIEAITVELTERSVRALFGIWRIEPPGVGVTALDDLTARPRRNHVRRPAD